MAHVRDRWTVAGPSGKKVKGPRWGRGMRWQAEWTEPDGTHRTKAFSLKDAAGAYLSDVEAAIGRGQYVSPAAGVVTLDSYGATWLGQQLHQRKSSGDQMRSRWKNHIAPQLGTRQLRSITRADVQAAVAIWSATLAPATVHVTYAYLAAALKAAAADRLIPESPCVRIRLPQIDSSRVIPLTVRQVALIAGRVAPRYKAMVLLGAATGVRPGELRGITADAEHLRFGASGVGIRIDRQLVTSTPTWGPPKTARSDRLITCGPSESELLRRHMAEHPPHPSGLIFTGRTGTPIGRSTLSEIWRAATDGMGLPSRSGWHDLRHFHASMLIAAGLSVTAVADRLGHQDPAETLRTYAHLWPSDESRAVRAVETGLWAAMNPTPLRLVDQADGYVAGTHARL